MIKKIKLFTLLFFPCLFHVSFVFAGIISNGWKDPRAYRPYPVLLLHGFGPGSSQSWTTEAKVDQNLNQYYSKYYTGYNSDPTILPSTRYPYLESIDFGSSLIDRNSSIDTYKIGDRYVQAGQRNLGDPGWSDKLNTAIETLRQYYINRDGSRQKIILVAHSMGGLAARKYLKSYSFTNQKIDKLIMIGTPNLGSEWATIFVTLNRNRRWGVYIAKIGWISSYMIDPIDRVLESIPHIDIDGDAVWDMDPDSTGSGFISELNNNYLQEVDHFAIAGKHWSDFNLGDGVVSLKSQLGEGVLSLKNKGEINAIHWTEPALSIAGDNPLLKFLDSTTPEFEITYPDPTQITGIYESSIHIKGRVYKEYLPADSKLHIKVIRENDGTVILDEDRPNSIKPSDLWIPNNPDSPVAEFDEVVNFPGDGIYTIRLSAINPAGVSSQEETVTVRVTTPSGWIVGPYRPVFDTSFAGWLRSDNTLSLHFLQDPHTEIYPWATITLENASSLRVGIPVYTDAVAVVIDSNTSFVGDYDNPCQVVFSRLDLRNLGYVSGTIRGQLRADLDNDGIWELHPFYGEFENVLVIVQ